MLSKPHGNLGKPHSAMAEIILRLPSAFDRLPAWASYLFLKVTWLAHGDDG